MFTLIRMGRTKQRRILMKSTGWKTTGHESDMRIAEFKTDDPHDTLVSYEEAKAQAIKTLRDHVAPYLARIEELEQDVFAETGALPPLKAWRQYHEPKAVVTATTKKRAMELTRKTRHCFDAGWHDCEGDWWYHLAQEEAVWAEERDDQKQGTGVFFKPLGREEAEQILDLFIAPYRMMNIDEILALVGQTWTVTGVSSHGTPYKITAEVRRRDWDKEHIRVEATIDDCLGWGWRRSVSVDRDLPELAVVGIEDRAKEGF
jgi:hypothetical protein